MKDTFYHVLHLENDIIQHNYGMSKTLMENYVDSLIITKNIPRNEIYIFHGNQCSAHIKNITISIQDANHPTDVNTIN